ncbi:MAG TPA: MFS transporter, partial [Conexibacter sp.]|nr:MFS transporter [Conexibacter sp.]
GCAMMPTMAGAYAHLEPLQVPRATAALNALQRTGGSIGTALLAVILTHELADALGGAAGSGGSLQPLPPALRERVAEPLASAFGSTFWWAFAITALAVLPSAALAVRERSEQRARAAAPVA